MTTICLKRLILCFDKKHKKNVRKTLDNCVGELNYNIVESSPIVLEVEFFNNDIIDFVMELKLYCKTIEYSEYLQVEEVGFEWKREDPTKVEGDVID